MKCSNTTPFADWAPMSAIHFQSVHTGTMEDEMHDLIADGYWWPDRVRHGRNRTHSGRTDGGATRAEAENELRWNGAA